MSGLNGRFDSAPPIPPLKVRLNNRGDFMKKSEQIAINQRVEKAIDIFNAKGGIDHKEGKRLRSCTAWVYENDDYYVLRSYNTTIAFIDKATDTLYDFLRLVYGFTSTSAQHIAKFRHDYGAGKWGCEHEYTYRAV